MKTMVLAVLLALSVSVQAQNVFLIGSNTSPPPDLYGNVTAPTTPAVATVVTAPPGTTVVVVPTVTYASPAPASTCGYSGYYEPYYPNYYPQYYQPNVMYIGGPGSCGPNYYPYARYDTANVIYFGGMQAARQGYNFRHCR